MAVRFNPLDPEFLENPYPTYAALRAESPVQRVRVNPFVNLRATWRVARSMMQATDQGIFSLLKGIVRGRRQMRGSGMGGPVFVLAKHPDVVYALRHAEQFSSRAMGGPPPAEDGGIQMSPTAGSLISVDPPEHRNHRNIVNKGFTPRRIAALEPMIRKTADELVSSFESKGECDLIDVFANPMPVSVIVELLGLDPARRDDFKRWTNVLIIGGTQPDATPRFEVMREFREFMRAAVEERRENPGDDLISLLVASEGEVLNTEQVIGFASLLLAAGSETTTNLIGNAMWRLRENPETLERVKADPNLIPQMLEESVRIDPPVQLLMRIATQPTEIGGVEIPEGAMVMPLLASANHDEEVFPNPDRFDIDRDTTGHVGFGWGNHFCLGAALARLEAKIALETLLERIPDFELARPVEMHGSFLIRGPKELHLKFSKRH